MQETLLDYAINTAPDPLQASPTIGNPNLASLTLVVSNSSGDLINCASITLSFLTGTNAEDFCSDSSGISGAVPTGWSLQQQGSLFIFSPDTKQAGEIGGGGLAFELSGIKVNQEPGTFQVTITENAADPDALPPAPQENRSTGITLTKFPPQFAVGELNSIPAPPIVDAGGSVTLLWNGSGSSGNYTALYEIEYADSDGNRVTISHPKGEPNQPLPPVGSYTIDGLEQTTTFYLIVTVQVQGQNSPLIFMREIPVTVVQPQPVINSFAIAANAIVSGQPLSFTLAWSVANVGDFQILANDGPNGQSRRLGAPFSLTGDFVVYPSQLETTYTLELLSGHNHASEE